MLINKDGITDKEVLFMLEQLEKAHLNNDSFSASVLLKRLENKKITLISEDDACKFGFIPLQ